MLKCFFARCAFHIGFVVSCSVASLAANPEPAIGSWSFTRTALDACLAKLEWADGTALMLRNTGGEDDHIELMLNNPSWKAGGHYVNILKIGFGRGIPWKIPNVEVGTLEFRISGELAFMNHLLQDEFLTIQYAGERFPQKKMTGATSILRRIDACARS